MADKGLAKNIMGSNLKYFGVTFLVILAGLYLVTVGMTGRTAIAAACVVDPHDVQDDG